MAFFVRIFPIRSYILFLPLFTKENVIQMYIKMKCLPYLQYKTLFPCQTQLYHCNILCLIFISHPPLPALQPLPYKDSRNKDLIFKSKSGGELRGSWF